MTHANVLIARPQTEELRDILKVHQLAFVAAHVGTSPGTTEHALTALVNAPRAIKNKTEYWRHAIGRNIGIHVARLAVNNMVIGVGEGIAIATDEGMVTKIASLYIQPEFWRQRIGSRLVGAATADFTYPTQLVEVAAATNAVAFWDGLGFKQTERKLPPISIPQYDISIPLIEMRRNVAPLA